MKIRKLEEEDSIIIKHSVLLSMFLFFMIPLKILSQSQQAIQINEVMVANIDMYHGPAYNFDGWCELYNASGSDVDMSGWTISDHKENFEKIEKAIIPSKGYCILWFGSKDVCKENISFNLDPDGGTLKLVDKFGEEILSFDYPISYARIAYARHPINEVWGYTAYPTPGSINCTEFASERLQSPSCSRASCLFNIPFKIKVEISDGSTLRYTTDGSVPTETNGEISIDGVFNIESTSIYRFRLFQKGYLPSNTITRSYIYSENGYSLPIVSIVTDNRFLYDDSLGIYVEGKNGKAGNGMETPANFNMDWERPVHFSYILPDGNEVFSQDVSMKISGGWSRRNTIKSFKLKGKKQFETSKNLDFQFFEEKPFLKNRAIQLRNGGQDSYGHIKDEMLSQIVRNSGIDIDLQSWQPVVHYLNDKYIGYINLREPHNKHYISANYGWGEDEIDQFEMNSYGYEQKCGFIDSFEELYQLSNNAADRDVYKDIQNRLDIDEYLNYMAVSLFLSLNDWPKNNIVGFRNKKDGKFRFILLDLDAAFWQEGNPFVRFANYQTYDEFRSYDDYLTYQEPQEIKFVTLFLNLLNNEQFCQRFVNVFCVYAGSVFAPLQCKDILDRMVEKCQSTLRAEKHYPSRTADDIITALTGRNEIILNYLKEFPQAKLANAHINNIKVATNNPNAILYVNDVKVPKSSFAGGIFNKVKISASSPYGYRFMYWVDANMNIISNDSTIIVDKDCELDAVFEKEDNINVHPIVINEISAANETYVNEFFKKEDWIELYNTTDEAIDIDGMYLSNDKDYPLMHKITKSNDVSTLIFPHGYLVVWCDKKDSKSQLHCNFKLKNDSGVVILTSQDEKWSDTLRYSSHDSNQTYGRYPDGSPMIYLFNYATILRTNKIGIYDLEYDFNEGISTAVTERKDLNDVGIIDYAKSEVYDFYGRKYGNYSNIKDNNLKGVFIIQFKDAAGKLGIKKVVL